MELTDEARPIHSDATMKLRPRLFLEGNYFVDLRPGQPERRRGRGRAHLPDQPDLLLGPARPGADDAPGRRPRRPADVPRPVRQRADQVRRRRGLPRALQELAPRVQVHLAGQRGAARNPAGGPAGRDPRPRRGGPRARTATRPRSRAWSRNFATVSGSFAPAGPGTRRGDSGAARRARGGAAGVRQPQRLVPGGPRVRPRGAARRALDARDPRRRRRRSSQQIRELVAEGRAARPHRRPAPDDPEAGEAGATSVAFLDSTRRSRAASTRSSSRGRRTRSSRSTGRPRTRSTRSGACSRRPLRARSGSARRAARATPTASTSGSRPAAARTRWSVPNRSGQRRRRPAGRDRRTTASRCSARCRASTTPPRPRSSRTSAVRRRSRRTSTAGVGQSVRSRPTPGRRARPTSSPGDAEPSSRAGAEAARAARRGGRRSSPSSGSEESGN